MIGRLRGAVRLLIHVEDSPHRIALSFGLGVFIAFSPLLGLHTALALLIAFAFRLSRAVIIVGIYVNNPWTIAPMYMAGTVVGCYLLGVPPGGLAAIDFTGHGWTFYRALLEHLRPYLWPFVVGNTLLGALSGFAAYLLLRRLLERRRARAAAD